MSVGQACVIFHLLTCGEPKDTCCTGAIRAIALCPQPTLGGGGVRYALLHTVIHYHNKASGKYSSLRESLIYRMCYNGNTLTLTIQFTHIVMSRAAIGLEGAIALPFFLNIVPTMSLIMKIGIAALEYLLQQIFNSRPYSALREKEH